MGRMSADFVERNSIEAEDLRSIDRDALVEMLRESSFARITGLVSRDEMRTARERIAENFDVTRDRATTGEHKDEVRQNFQKLSIGRARHGKVDRPRFMRTLYNPLWCEDIYGLHSAFSRQCQLRNLLGGMKEDFATTSPEDEVWTACRIHHFPTGGGFMVGHRDTVLPAFYDSIDLPFYQSLLLITEKGVDFETGGGFVEIDGEHLDYERQCQAGDIVIYDQQTIHGVDDIDPHKPFVQDSLTGRMSGLVTLYRTL